MKHLFRVTAVLLLPLMGLFLFVANAGIAGARTLSPAVWTVTDSLNVARTHMSEFLLPTGEALIVNYNGEPTTELYNPANGTWLATASMNFTRNFHAAILLPNGQVLVAGGYGIRLRPSKTSELYTPAT